MKVVAVYATLLVPDQADEDEVRSVLGDAGAVVRASGVLLDEPDAISLSTVISTLPDYLADGA